MHILIHRLGSLGDTVVALPCFYALRQAYPNARITVLTNSPVSHKAAPLEAILKNTNLVDETIPYPIGVRDWKKLAVLRAELRLRQFDSLISLTPRRDLHSCLRDYLFFKSCNIPRIIGMPWAKRDRICQMKGNGPDYEREADRLLRRIRRIGQLDPQDSRWTDLQLTSTETAQAAYSLQEAGLGGEFIVSSQGTKIKLNDWRAERWGDLYERIGKNYPDLALVLLGSEDEFARSEALLQRWKGPRANLCGKLSPRVSAAVMRKARVFIGHDSGPTHLSAAVGTKCVVIYSAYNPPGQWFPLGSGHMPLYPYAFYKPHLWLDAEHQREALDSISVEEVYSATRQILG